MPLLFNDLSLHGQLNVRQFRDAIRLVIGMRDAARAYGVEISCSRTTCTADVGTGLTMQAAVGSLRREEQTAVMQWLTRGGPFWSDSAEHTPDDYVECEHDLVSESAVAEAAVMRLRGEDAHLVGVAPSKWTYSPIKALCGVTGHLEGEIEIPNYWEMAPLQAALPLMVPESTSWEQVAAQSMSRFRDLVFSDNCFEPLVPVPFSRSAALRILNLLDQLNVLNGCWGRDGRRTAVGQQIYKDFFTGDRAWFSDSSETEKIEFRGRLTFKHPNNGPDLFCPWHGKVSRSLLRVHFYWPVNAGSDLYVVYVGPKITKR